MESLNESKKSVKTDRVKKIIDGENGSGNGKAEKVIEIEISGQPVDNTPESNDNKTDQNESANIAKICAIKTLKESLTNDLRDRMVLIERGLWDSKTVLDFNASGTQGSGIIGSSAEAGCVKIETMTIAQTVSDDNVTLIKFTNIKQKNP